jgi:general secretion pathway protein E
MGVKGRTVCAEVIMLDLDMIQLIGDGETIKLMQYWRNLSDGNPFSENMRGKTCMEHAFQKMLCGLVCPFDLEDSFKPINEMRLAKVKTQKTHHLDKKTESEMDAIKTKAEGGWDNI